MVIKKRNTISLILTLIFIVNIGSIQIFAHEGEVHYDSIADNVWDLLDWNENEPLIWWGRNFNVTANIGSKIIYNVTQVNENNFTYPNSGLFSFGNVSNLETNNNEIAGILALSILPWSPGLITQATNWTQSINEVENIAKTSQWLKGSLNVDKNFNYNYNEEQRDSIKFEYTQIIKI